MTKKWKAEVALKLGLLGSMAFLFEKIFIYKV